jgi:hypothetical protein
MFFLYYNLHIVHQHAGSVTGGMLGWVQEVAVVAQRQQKIINKSTEACGARLTQITEVGG